MTAQKITFSLALTLGVLPAILFAVVGCDRAATPEKEKAATEVPGPDPPSEDSLEKRLVGDWTLDRDQTISATKAAAEKAGKGKSVAEAALREYLENEASPDDATKIKDLLQSGSSPEEILAMVTAMKSGVSPYDLVSQMAMPIEYFDLALEVTFDGNDFLTSESDQSWPYSVSEIGDSSGQMTLELQGDAQPWKMKIALTDATLTIDDVKTFFQMTGTPPGQISRLPSPMVLVFQRTSTENPR